jgi:hypothetical protein
MMLPVKIACPERFSLVQIHANPELPNQTWYFAKVLVD